MIRILIFLTLLLSTHLHGKVQFSSDIVMHHLVSDHESAWIAFCKSWKKSRNNGLAVTSEYISPPDIESKSDNFVKTKFLGSPLIFNKEINYRYFFVEYDLENSVYTLVLQSDDKNRGVIYKKSKTNYLLAERENLTQAMAAEVAGAKMIFNDPVPEYKLLYLSLMNGNSMPACQAKTVLQDARIMYLREWNFIWKIHYPEYMLLNKTETELEFISVYRHEEQNIVEHVLENGKDTVSVGYIDKTKSSGFIPSYRSALSNLSKAGFEHDESLQGVLSYLTGREDLEYVRNQLMAVGLIELKPNNDVVSE